MTTNLLTKVPIYAGAFGTPGTPGTPATPPSSVVVCRTFTPVTLVRDPVTGAYIFQPGAPTTVCEARTIPGSPGTPGTPGTPPDVVIRFSLGWNAAADSINFMPDEGRYQFSVPQGVGIVAGLTTISEDSGYREIDYALSFNHNEVYVIENGAAVPGSFVYAETDVFSVQRVGITVTYWQNNTLLYTSLVPSYGSLFADSSLYAIGDSIKDSSYQTASLGGRGGSSYASFEPLESVGSRTGYTYSIKSFQKLTTAMTVRRVQGSSTSFESLIALSADHAYADSQAKFAAMTTDISIALLTPDSALSAASFQSLLPAGFVLTGQNALAPGNVNFKPLKTLSSNKAYADSQAEFAPLTTLALPPFFIVGWSDLLFRNAFTMRATGSELAPNSFYGAMPMSFTAFSGAQVRVPMPSPQMLITGTGTVIGRAYLQPGSFTVAVSGTPGGISEIAVGILDPFVVRAYSGAVVALELQDGFTLMVTANAGLVGRVRVRLPMFDLVASGTVNDLSSAYLTMPMLQPVSSGLARFALPGFTLEAMGSAVVVLTDASYEAYVVNLLHAPPTPGEETVQEVTRYANYPFEQIVRWQDKYYGVARDGLYLLEGPDDDGVPIAWNFHTCDTDFKTHNHKTVASVYASGRVDAGFTAKVVIDRRTTYTYQYATPRDEFPQNHRQKFGKGLKATYYSFGFSDAAGRTFHLNNAEFEVYNLKRAV